MLPQHITYQLGGTITVDLQSRPINATVAIYDNDGTQLLSPQVANVSTINTSLITAVSKGDTIVNVASNTGISNGKVFWIQDDPEALLVTKVAGGEVTIRRPARNDHVNASTVEGTELAFAVNSSSANALFWDGHAEWNICTSEGLYVVEHTSLECTKYPLRDLTSDQDIFDEDAKIADKLDAEHDMVRSRWKAAQDLFMKIGQRDRARVFADSGHSFKRAIVFQWFVNFWRPKAGDEAREMRRTYEEALDGALKQLGILPRDTDQDGVKEIDERINFRSVEIRRA